MSGSNLATTMCMAYGNMMTLPYAACHIAGSRAHTAAAFLSHTCSPLLLALGDLVGFEPVTRDIEGAGIIIWMFWPALLGIHDPVWPQKCELVCSSGCIPLCVTVLDRLSSPTCTAAKDFTKHERTHSYSVTNPCDDLNCLPLSPARPTSPLGPLHRQTPPSPTCDSSTPALLKIQELFCLTAS